MRPSVDIIIPFHGKYEFVTRSVSSIFRNTPNQEYRIILVDDASPNVHYLRQLASVNRKIVPVQVEEQVGFGGALEAGYQASEAANLVFIHSDVWVENINWLGNLQRAYNNLRESKVKIVSARTNHPGTASAWDPRIIGAADDIVQDTSVDIPIPLHCAFCHRDLFRHCGGFIKSYPYGWYEDEELFYRMKYYGFRQGIAGKSYVLHEGGATIKDLVKDQSIGSIMEANREQCQEDVRPYLSRK